MSRFFHKIGRPSRVRAPEIIADVQAKEYSPDKIAMHTVKKFLMKEGDNLYFLQRYMEFFFVLINIYVKFEFVMKKEEYIYSLDIDVRDYELDSEGIVNNANYLHYLEMTRHEFCKTSGMSFDEMRRQGIIPVLSRVEIDYVTSLVSGDRMTSCLNLSRKGPRFVFQQDIYNQRGEVVVKAIVSVVTLENGRLSRGEALAKVFAQFL